LTDYSGDKIGIEGENYWPLYDLKTNKDKPDHSLLKKLIDNVSIRDSEEFGVEQSKALIDEVVNVDNFLRYSALCWVLGLPDDLRSNSNNYYLYFDGSGKAYFIPYDNDRCLGILQDWPIHMEYRPINDNYKAGNNDERQTCFLLWRTCISGKQSMPVIKEYQEQYVSYCKEYAKKYLDVNKFQEFTNQYYYADKDIKNPGGSNMSFKEYATIKLGVANE